MISQKCRTGLGEHRRCVCFSLVQFQGTMAHTAPTTRRVFRIKFTRRLISILCDITWSAHSSDLTNTFLWSKSQVFIIIQQTDPIKKYYLTENGPNSGEHVESLIGNLRKPLHQCKEYGGHHHQATLYNPSVHFWFVKPKHECYL